MSDVFDRAQDLELEQREAAIQAVRQQINVFTPSAEFCEVPDCESPIPEARRRAIPGCRFCVDCQERIEQNQALFARFHY